MFLTTETTEQELIILFTDIVGFTKYTATKGSSAGLALRRTHDAIVAEPIAQSGGIVVKSTGDGLIAHFKDARSSVSAAIKIQEALASYNLNRAADEQIHVREGIAAGTAVIHEGDIIGQAVNLAARLVGVCKQDQILISKRVYKALRPARHVTLRKYGVTSLHGISGQEEVFEVGWHLETLIEKEKGAVFPPVRPVREKLLAATLLLLIIAAASYWALWGRQRPLLAPGAEAGSPSRTLSEKERLYSTALSYYQKGDDEEALTALNGAIAVDPGYAKAYLEAALISHGIDDDTKAEQYLSRAKELEKSVKDEAFRLRTDALALEINGELDTALQQYQLLVDAYPGDLEGESSYAELAMQLGRFDEAQKALSGCLSLAPRNADCNYGQMELLIRRNQFDQGISFFETSSRMNPNYPWWEELDGIAYYGKDELDKALEHFRQLELKGGKLHGTTYLDVAKHYEFDVDLYQGHIASARHQVLFRSTASQKPEIRASDFLDLAAIEMFAGNRSNARSFTLKAVSLAENPLTVIAAIKLFAEIGDEKSVSQFERLKLKNGKPVGMLGVANQHLINGLLAQNAGHFAEAIEELKSSREIDPDVEKTDALAKLYIKARRFKDAVPLLIRVIDSKGQILLDFDSAIWPVAHYNLAFCYDQLGDRENALEEYQRFLNLWASADQNLTQVSRAKTRALELKKRT